MNTKDKQLMPKIEWKHLIWALIVIVLVFCTIYFSFQYLLSKNYITGPSMQPNFKSGNHVIAIRNAPINRGDVIILKAPDEKNELYIKRVIGLPGDKLTSKNNKIYINGKLYKEDFLQAGSKLKEPKNSVYGNLPYSYTYAFTINSLAQSPDWQKVYSKPYLLKIQKLNRVPNNDYFVMGDHRTVSKDSRLIGFIKQKAVVGKVALRYWPLSDFTVY
ncbi:signal peptidase I [Companilactobacillus sp.]|jgi:signal peptidase I|uniref:signal peptidase I n=1 Tax=Companilactobacillus sp. TaxID=2767905 RepID=UPI0025C15D51|nr:signal peptidase I [Companilactobacillus sp.]MCH4009067.1 signal peptidase I [Companilactobacillus sp.]MCH4050754.1 signal peptidase I [Companilactobacillus sp.]MCH4077009.1 signal peptidase I [Companilactobacillus sp.]MCH4125585.1 signal peptidase I [Companilactobacillus sp.]MCI1311294.1 signal peptidase I [Companilactobacillus sp.]